MKDDPIVDEIRAIREQLAAQFDFDIRKIVADAQRRQAESKSKVVSFQHVPGPAQQAAGAPRPSRRNTRAARATQDWPVRQEL